MSIINMDNILKVLSSFNPWWKTDSFPPAMAKPYRRLAFFEAMKQLTRVGLRRTIVLTGIRRVGKTTIQQQIIEALLKEEGARAEQILYVSLDHPMLKLGGIGYILSCYHENIHAGQDVYYFFDEVQYAPDWDQWLKTIYDTQPETKVVATGSASPVLMHGNQESGVGRWSVLPVPTLSFYEYCALIEAPRPTLTPNVKPSALPDMPPQERTQLMMQLSMVQNHFTRYLQIGGFPELALANDDLTAQRLMREDVADKILKRDLPALYKIRNATELERIFLYICNVSSDIVSIDAIAKELNGVSRQTVENYIQYMESANLIYRSWPIQLTGKRILKARAKVYVADAAIRNAVLMDESLLSNPTELSKIVETSVYKHVAAFYYHEAASIGYFRNGGKGKEIDIVVEYPRIRPLLIEVKYREQAEVAEKDAISSLAGTASASFIITKRAEDYGIQKAPNGTPMLRIPAFAFLYLLGHAEQIAYQEGL